MSMFANRSIWPQSVLGLIESVVSSPPMMCVRSRGLMIRSDATVPLLVLWRSTTDWIFLSAYSTNPLLTFCFASNTA